MILSIKVFYILITILFYRMQMQYLLSSLCIFVRCSLTLLNFFHHYTRLNISPYFLSLFVSGLSLSFHISPWFSLSYYDSHGHSPYLILASPNLSNQCLLLNALPISICLSSFHVPPISPYLTPSLPVFLCIHLNWYIFFDDNGILVNKIF